MPTRAASESKSEGISDLPKKWSVAVQLVGTFGLAVFLVLYYVLVMQPKDAARYDQLRQSIDKLGETIAGQQNLITREQESRLQDLYLIAMGNEVATLLVSELKGSANAEALTKKIEDRLIVETRLLEGLRRQDGGAISEMMTNKIRNTEISKEIARRAIADWKNTDRETIAGECRRALTFAMQMAAKAK